MNVTSGLAVGEKKVWYYAMQHIHNCTVLCTIYAVCTERKLSCQTVTIVEFPLQASTITPELYSSHKMYENLLSRKWY
jgi:hypothetical protein